MELVLQGVQTVAVAGAGAKLGNVKAGSMGHVDHESVGEDHQVVLLRKGKTNRLRQQNVEIMKPNLAYVFSQLNNKCLILAHFDDFRNDV